jgi:uncharacterized metal-binding protein YceD (DUF177 family)
MSAINSYRIAFVSLKTGIHHYEFKADKTFFLEFEQSVIENAELTYSVELEKLTNLMNVNTEVSGKVFTICDRCGDSLEKVVSGSFQLVVKFGDETSDVADDIVVLGPAEHILNLDQLFYEYAHLCLNHRNVHETEDLCNQKALETLREYELREKEEGDPRWSKLKDLK